MNLIWEISLYSLSYCIEIKSDFPDSFIFIVIKIENNSDLLKYIETFLNEIIFGSLYISKIISLLLSLNSSLCKLFPFISSNTFKHWGTSTLIVW